MCTSKQMYFSTKQLKTEIRNFSCISIYSYVKIQFCKNVMIDSGIKNNTYSKTGNR